MRIDTDNWYYSPDHGQICQVVEAQTLWGETVYRVWFPETDAVIRLRPGQLVPASEGFIESSSRIAYVTAAARIADVLGVDAADGNTRVLLAPIDADVIPLPHQVKALRRATSSHRLRYLLADEVGLGKTIEAGLIMRELKLRGLVRRTLIVAPKGLVTQWTAEMRTHFGEEFHILIPGDFSVYRRIAREDNLWRTYDQVVCPLDSVKPLEGRRGWSREQVAEYNRERFEDLISAGWDLVVVDEAHRLGGSTDQVARYWLGQGLAEAAPYLLLLSATPHQGKTDSFHRLVSLLDPVAFPDAASLKMERVQPYVIRTEKRRAIDAEGRPLFKPRYTQLVPVAWEDRHREQRALYEAVTDYVREGYNQALKEKKQYIGFLMILMQRLVTSSTRAIRAALERRLEVLQAPEDQPQPTPTLTDEEWADLDGQEQLDAILNIRWNAPWNANENERLEVESLLEAARRTEMAGSDAKSEALLDWIYRLQQEETDPELKVLIFTEFVPTQEMLFEFLTARGIKAVCLNGSMGMKERKEAEEAFATRARVLISTDAGGEGLNLQFCHVVINDDIPWNPMRLEQRIGRVDRIGQVRPVRAINFIIEKSVEYRVRQVLEQKLAVILAEFGVDKTGDVLDSAQSGSIFDEVYVGSVLDPDSLDTRVESLVGYVREQAQAARESVALLGSAQELDPGDARGLRDHPLPYWVERMTVGFVEAQGGTAERKGRSWDIAWPDGERNEAVVFTPRDAETETAAARLTLEAPRIRALVERLPRFVEGQPIPRIVLPGLPPGIHGLWSLWRITIAGTGFKRQRIMPLFLQDEGQIYLPTARHIWERMLSGDMVEPTDYIGGQEAASAFRRVRLAAEGQGKDIYDELVQAHRQWLSREREKGEYSFGARRRALGRIGLQAVRSHRLRLLAQEERIWQEELARRAEVMPEMEALIVVRIEGVSG